MGNGNGWIRWDKVLTVASKGAVLLAMVWGTGWGAARYAVNQAINEAVATRTAAMIQTISENREMIEANADSIAQQGESDSAVAAQIYRLSEMIVDLSDAIEAVDGSIEEKIALQKLRRRAVAIPSTGGP